MSFCVLTNNFKTSRHNGFGLSRVSYMETPICEVLVAPSVDTDMMVLHIALDLCRKHADVYSCLSPLFSEYR
jgi:hypothetical protein